MAFVSHPGIDSTLLAALFHGELDVSFLATQLQLPIPEIETRLRIFQQLGYQIEKHPYRGYTLTHCPDILIADEIRARLPQNRFAKQLTVYRETRSTNELVFKAGLNNLTEGFCVLAESQTHGKGRKGRFWQSIPNKGLWLSLLLRPQWPTEQAGHLTYLASVALCRTISKTTKLDCAIKWPNDVLIDGKKIAGILTEINSKGNTLNFAVLGIGCNVSHALEDFSPELREKVSSLVLSGASSTLRRADFLVALLAEIESLYTQPWSMIYQQWKNLCLTIGKTIQVQTEQQIVSGQMAGLTDSGHLLLRLPSGKIETIHSGDVLW